MVPKSRKTSANLGNKSTNIRKKKTEISKEYEITLFNQVSPIYHTKFVNLVTREHTTSNKGLLNHPKSTLLV